MKFAQAARELLALRYEHGRRGRPIRADELAAMSAAMRALHEALIVWVRTSG